MRFCRSLISLIGIDDGRDFCQCVFLRALMLPERAFLRGFDDDNAGSDLTVLCVFEGWLKCLFSGAWRHLDVRSEHFYHGVLALADKLKGGLIKI